jgi:hypothetical protein
MKRNIYILLIFVAFLSCAKTQNEKRGTKLTITNLVDNTCSEMKAQAIEDLKAGRYKLYEFGIVSSPDTNTTILKQLNIELISGGCNVTEGIDCYKAIMDSAIRVKYKNEIIEYTADGFDRIRFKNEFYNLTDSTLFRQNTKKITKTLNNLNGLTEGKACIQILINKTGKPIKIKWLKGLDKKNDLIMIEKLMKEKFEPLSIGKEKVNSIMTIPIIIK